MNKRKIIIFITLGMIAVSGFLFGITKTFNKLDIVGIQSLSSFKIITEELSKNISMDKKWNSWKLESPDNSIKFYFSKDLNKTEIYDVMLEFETEPFIKAGLDINKLPDNYIVEDTIMVGTNLGDEKIVYNNEITPYMTYEKIVNLKREIISYHSVLDHYGINLGDGNMFEWAKDIDVNDKDIVFVLNPEPFIKAGVDPKKVEGWIYTKVPIMKDGKKLEVYKFLKVFDLK